MDAAGLAIALSGTVLKLVVFSLDFISDVKQVHKNGATDRNVDLSTVAESVALVTTSLENQLAAASKDGLGERRQLDTDEIVSTSCIFLCQIHFKENLRESTCALTRYQQLKSLSVRAAEIGQELARKLSKATTDKKSTWKSFKAAALGMWDANDIEQTERRLNAIKDEIQLSILVGIRNKVNQSNDDGNSRVLAALEEVAGKQARSKDDSEHMIELLNDADKIGRGRHEELIQLGNHLLYTIRALSNPTSPANTPLPATSTYLYDDNVRQAAENMVLSSVWYPSIHDREETIHEAHVNTFQWIFEDPTETGNQWDSFVDFLQGDTPSYWITGKPGSGKSTLIKYINQTPKTQDYLGQWAGEKTLIQASHYFYYSGGADVKTELGLFKSLLHSILDKRRDLIPVAFRDRFQAALEGRKHDDPSLPEAKRALMDLIRQHPDTNFFFSLDGLDEFDPEASMTHVQSLLDFTHFLEKCQNVKVLVSSRPLPEFERGYDGRPFLKVQDLTRGDIRRYARERLEAHPRMKILEKKDPERTGALLESIVDSSVGVFLWVRVVTESLLEALTNNDSIDDLQKILQGLPSDLHALYSTILGRVKPSYKPKAARLLCIVHHAQTHGEVLSLLDLWFADNADDTMVHNTPIGSITDEDFLDKVNELETRLKSQCLGLIETEPDTLGPSSIPKLFSPLIRHPPVGDKVVYARFLHRSVYEFLNRPDIQSEVVKKYLGCTFSAALALFRSIILLIKTYRRYPNVSWREIIFLAKCAGHRASWAERQTKQPHCRLVHGLDLAMSGVMPLVNLAANAAGDSNPALTSLLHQDCHWWAWCRHYNLFDFSFFRNLKPLHDRTHASLMAFAAECGLSCYIQSQVSEKGREVLLKKGLPLLGYAMMPGIDPRLSACSDVLQLLLDEGCDPNEIYNGLSLWEWHLWTMYPHHHLSYSSNTSIGTWITEGRLEALETLLLGGADPNGLMTHASSLRVLANLVDRVSPWTPIDPTRRRSPSSVCTILLEISRQHQYLNEYAVDLSAEPRKSIRNVQERVLRIIAFLNDRGALAKEWENTEDVKRIYLDVCQRIADKESLILDGWEEPREFSSADEDSEASDALLGTTTPKASITPEIPVDPTPPDVTGSKRGGDGVTKIVIEKKSRQVESLFLDAGEIAKASKKGWSRVYYKMIQKVKQLI